MIRLFKAFLIVLLCAAIATSVLVYLQKPTREQLNKMANIYTAVTEFYSTYKVYPCSGSMDSSCYTELEGGKDAIINNQHINFLQKNGIESLSDNWGNSYVMVPTKSSSDFPDVVIISCGPNGIFEKGAGDDIVFPAK